MAVPDNLIGPLKYASETINIEQLQVPKPINDHFEETGEKLASLVTGSCGSITISAVTVKFVEDMINKYQNIEVANPLDLFDEFRNEYDKRIHNYLCGRGIEEPIPWYDHTYFGEPEIYNMGDDKCNKNNNNNNNNYKNDLSLSYQNSGNSNSGILQTFNHFTQPRSHEPG